MSGDEERDGVRLTNLDQPLFDEAAATKRDLVDYLDAVRDRILPVLADRPLSVIRALRGQAPFMQKNVPKYTPSYVRTVTVWAEASKREVSYALCNDRRTLLWFANQRAIEYHPGLVRAADPEHPTHLVLDIDPPAGDTFGLAVRAAHLVRQALADVGLAGAVKTSGAKGVHVFVPLDGSAAAFDAAAATRAIGARAERLESRARDHGLHPGRPGGQGLHRLHPGGRRHRRRRVQPAAAARHAGVVPGPVGGTGPRHAG